MTQKTQPSKSRGENSEEVYEGDSGKGNAENARRTNKSGKEKKVGEIIKSVHGRSAIEGGRYCKRGNSGGDPNSKVKGDITLGRHLNLNGTLISMREEKLRKGETHPNH